MESVFIWYLTDNAQGADVSEKIRTMCSNVELIQNKDVKKALKKHVIKETEINIFIYDFVNIDFSEILSAVKKDERLQPCQKFIILNKSRIKEALNTSISFMHLEFLSRPLNNREFILLLEKTVIVERYREVMQYISKEADARIGSYENLMDINRRELFVTDEEKKDFKNIINYEKNLLKKQNELNKAIREYTLLRQKEMFYEKNKAKVDEMLEELRRQELLDAGKVIKAQENVIDFSSGKLMEANKIINAKDKAGELGRWEALSLHAEIKKLREKNERQASEISNLRKQLSISKSDKSNKRSAKE